MSHDNLLSSVALREAVNLLKTSLKNAFGQPPNATSSLEHVWDVDTISNAAEATKQ